MNIKTVIQLLIFFIIVIFLYFFIKNTFLQEQKEIVSLDLSKEEIIEEIKTDKKEKNIIEKINTYQLTQKVMNIY